MISRIGIDLGSQTLKAVELVQARSKGWEIRACPIVETRGRPLDRVLDVLAQLAGGENGASALVGLTGAGAAAVAEILGIRPLDESLCLTSAVGELQPGLRTLIEMGRESQKFILLERDVESGQVLLKDAAFGHKCAAGTGSFFDHMYRRLNYASLEEFAQVAYETESPATLSGRCAVFTESDIVHLYQKGTPRERIAAGIHQAICRNYRAAIARGREPRPAIGFVGGVSCNPAVRKYLAEAFGIEEQQILVPEHNRTLGAIGAALRAEIEVPLGEARSRLAASASARFEYPTTPPLRLVRSICLTPPPQNGVPRRLRLAALGVDIGSVSTKAALITQDEGEWRVLASHYRRTDGDPLEAVRDTVSQIHRQALAQGLELERVVCATTGSGRYLTADYLGADLIKNEITAQANGALCFATSADSIFEIGGQDSKFIRMEGEVITDFEMNKACAAGTGAFLEKQAANLGLPIEEFGEHALRGEAPPDLDWQCTVFSESAMVYYQQNSVPLDDLCAGICLASAKNYLSKNVGGRSYGDRIAFQGAVAFNKGMVAAFETLTGKTVVVPPYPHLTGAVGAAKLAYEQAPTGEAFRGFDAVARGGYSISSFECKTCENRCDVNVFEMDDGQKYYYNDRCERFSGLQKEDLSEGLPDLFAEREAFLLACHQPGLNGGPRVGIPRTLMFSEYFPLFCTFFQELGCEVVLSDATNKRLAKAGVAATAGEPCFPLKVAHGHFADVLEKGIDYLFAPGICDSEQPNSSYASSKTCPYVASAPEVIAAALDLPKPGVTCLAPRLYFSRGERHVGQVLTDVGAKLGRPREQCRQALDAAFRAQQSFTDQCLHRGKEAYDALRGDQTAFVVIGRPYALHDRAVNMDIGRKIQEMGLLALPFDMLPVDDEDVSDNWSNLYARQVQRKMSAARMIGEDARLRAVVLTYYGCGPDAFSNPFFKDELNEPCYVMQIDAHTADAGVVTRLEAFADTVRLHETSKQRPSFDTRPTRIDELAGRRLWVPYGSESAHIFAATLRAYGIDAAVLPRSPDPGMNLARAQITEDVCLPALVTTEDYLARANAPDFDPEREAFMQGGSQGPCRLGMYFMLQKRILDQLGYGQVPIVPFGGDNPLTGLGITWAICTWDLLIAHDLLEKLLLHARPYERDPGRSDALFQRYLRQLCDLAPSQKALLGSRSGQVLTTLGLHLERVKATLAEAAEAFAAVPRTGEARPGIGLLGEWYVRIHSDSNQDIVRKLEAEGAEVLQAPMTEFAAYSNRITYSLQMQEWRDTNCGGLLRAGLGRKLHDRIATRDEHLLFEAVAAYLPGLGETSAQELINLGSRWVHPAFGGEAICSMGRAEELLTRGMDGFVNVIPFNCMPGIVVTQLSEAFRKEHGGVPFLNLDYDGFQDSSRETKIRAFMAQVKERHRLRAARQQAAA